MKLELARSAAAVGALCTLSFTPLAQAAQASIRGVGGWTSGDVVINGRFTGQKATPKKGPYFKDAHKDFLAVESQNNSASFTIWGKNFGLDTGRVRFLTSAGNRLSGVTVTVKEWRDDKVVVVARSGFTFTSVPSGAIEVTRATKPKRSPKEAVASFPIKGFVGVISTRGFGQCTWQVAFERLSAGLTLPSGAFATNTTIDSAYVPQQWDVVQYSPNHTVIIVTKPQMTTKPDGERRYSFDIRERNSWLDEAPHSSTREFGVRGDKVVTTIGSDAGGTYKAKGVWR